MPLFRSKFQPKKSPPRKATNNSNRNLDAAQIEQEFGIQFDKVVLNLDDQLQFEFDNKGKWIQQNRSKSVTPTSQISRKLQSDNELLRIQVELLLNMLTETTLEAHITDFKKSEDSVLKSGKSPKRRVKNI